MYWSSRTPLCHPEALRMTMFSGERVISMRISFATGVLMCVVLSASTAAQDKPKSVALPRGTSPSDAAAFMDAAEKELADLQVKANQAQWVSENFITDDTE